MGRVFEADAPGRALMDALNVKDLAIIATPFLLFALSGIVAIAGFLIRNMVVDLKASVKEAVEKAERAERNWMEDKARLPERYVFRDDYIRSISQFEYKLDGLGKKIDSLSRRSDGESGI